MQRVYKSIYNGSFDPSQFAHEVPPNCCVFHGSSEHTTDDCNVIKKTKDKALLLRKQTSTITAPPPTPPSQTPRALAVMPPPVAHSMPPPSVLSQVNSISLSALHGDDSSVKDNDTNSPVTSYLNIYSRHILLDPVASTSHHNKTKFILDSGAYPQLCNNRFLFDSYYDWPMSAKSPACPTCRWGVQSKDSRNWNHCHHNPIPQHTSP